MRQDKIISCLMLLAITIVLVGLPFQTSAEHKKTNKVTCSDCNLINKEGKKDGLWNEDTGHGLEEIYYKNGLRDGVYKRYNAVNGKLMFFGEYTKGKQSGSWYFFNENGHLILMDKKIGQNTDLTVMRDDGKRIKPNNKSYIKEYYYIGVIKEEGIALYDDDDSPEIFFFKKGKWQYYDSSGKLIKTEIHDGEYD